MKREDNSNEIGESWIYWLAKKKARVSLASGMAGPRGDNNIFEDALS